jgi:hypothetical protein
MEAMGIQYRWAGRQLGGMRKPSPIPIPHIQHCHRSLIADYLTLQGLRVIHLLDSEISQDHQR